MSYDLRRLNFHDLITIKTNDPGRYDFKAYRANGFKHDIECFCTSCEAKGFNLEKGAKPEQPDAYRLQAMSHGTLGQDFLDWAINPPNTNGWHEEPIMFLTEGPGPVYDIHNGLNCNGHTKKPTNKWYWIEKDSMAMPHFPQHFFELWQYGLTVASIMHTFRLKNIYFTNIVKCGLNPHNMTGFKNILNYNPECLKNCFDNFLSKEMELLAPKIVFVFGSNAYGHLDWLLKLKPVGQYQIIQLPHFSPRGLKGNFFGTIIFARILKALHRAGILKRDEERDLMDKYFASADDM